MNRNGLNYCVCLACFNFSFIPHHKYRNTSAHPNRKVIILLYPHEKLITFFDSQGWSYRLFLTSCHCDLVNFRRLDGQLFFPLQLRAFYGLIFYCHLLSTAFIHFLSRVSYLNQCFSVLLVRNHFKKESYLVKRVWCPSNSQPVILWVSLSIGQRRSNF